jgi:hypothetical protein
MWSVERLLAEVAERKLDFFSISDHDGLEAYPLPDTVAARNIPALEVDSHHGGHTAHLLAYGIADKASPLLLALAGQRAARTERMASMVAALRAKGAEISMDDVRAQASGTAGLGRPHLARALVTRRIVATVQEAFDRYLADEGPAYVALERLTSADAVRLIHESGGVAVVAHPQRLRSATALDDLIDLGVDGIEVVHPTADGEMRRRLTDKAREHGLLITGGTDFHAPVEDRPIGVPFPRSDVERLLEAIAQRVVQ